MPKRRRIDPRLAPQGFCPDPSIPPLRVVVLAETGSVAEFDAAEGFRAAGHQVLTLRYVKSGTAIRFAAPDEQPGHLADRVLKFAPHLILSLNITGIGFSRLFPGLAEIERVPLVVWFADFPPAELPMAVPPESEFALILAYDASQLPRVRGMGYRCVEHLPLGTSPVRFPLPEKDHPEPSIPIGYAGNLHQRLIESNRRCLEDRIRGFPEEQRSLFDALFEEGAAHLGAFDAPPETAWEWLQREGPPRFAQPDRALRPVAHYLSWMISHAASARIRKRLALRLDSLGLHVWGDAWEGVIEPARCHANVPYDRLHRVYHSCRVNLSVSHAQNVNSVTQRLFDVPACGGFVLSDWRPCMADLFDVGKELVVFHSPDEAFELAQRYIADAPARNEVARRARARVLAEHTYIHRAEWIARAVLDRWPETADRPARRKTVRMTSPPAVAAPLLGQVASALIEGGRDKPLERICEALKGQSEGRAILAQLDGDEAFARKDYRGAVEKYREAIEGGGAASDMLQFNAGRCLLRLDDPAAALPFFLEAARLCPAHPIYWSGVACCHLKLEDWGRGRTTLETALALDPACATALELWAAFRAELEGCKPLLEG